MNRGALVKQKADKMGEPVTSLDNELDKNSTESSEITNCQSCEDIDLKLETVTRDEVIKNVQLQTLAVDTDHVINDHVNIHMHRLDAEKQKPETTSIHSVDHIARLERHRRLAKLVSTLVFVATIAGILSLFIKSLSKGCYDDFNIAWFEDN